MDNVNIVGINSSYTPLSDAFSIDIINKEVSLNKNISSITNMNISISSNYIDSFNVLDKKFITVLLNINIRFDYICNENSINYEIISENKLMNICVGNNKVNKNIINHAQILDADITNIHSSTIIFYIIFICSLDI